MNRVIATLVLVVIILSAALTIVLVDEAVGGYLPPCPTEDSDNCYWDADTMGNRQGTDSVVLTSH